MSNLFEDINKVTNNKSSQTQKEAPRTDESFILSEGNIHAQMEQVRLQEAKKVNEYNKPALTSIAKSLMSIAEVSDKNTDYEPQNAIMESLNQLPVKKHLRESWKQVGQLVEKSHTVHGLDIKEMLNNFSNEQIELMEISLELPWKLKLPKDEVPVEVTDYAIPGQDQVFKGTTGRESPEEADEVEDDTKAEYPTESKNFSSKLKQKREKL